MINDKLKNIEKNAKSAGLSENYIASRILKIADDSIYDETDFSEHGIRREVDLPQGHVYERWDITQNSEGIISKIEELETSTRDKLVDTFKSHYREFTEDELRKIYPYIKQKAILFKWICKLKDKEYDEIPWGELVADNALGMFHPESSHQTKILAQLESEELEKSFESLQEYKKLVDEIQEEGIFDENGENILETEQGRLLHGLVANFAIEENIVGELAGAIIDGELGESIEGRIDLMISSRGGAEDVAQVSIGESFGRDYGSMLDIYSNASRDFGALQQFYDSDHVLSKHYLSVMSEDFNWNDQELIKNMALEYWNSKEWSSGEETPSMYSEVSTESNSFQWNDNIDQIVYEWKLKMQEMSDDVRSIPNLTPSIFPYAIESPWETFIEENDILIDGDNFWEENIGVWNPRWAYYSNINKIANESVSESELNNIQSITDLDFGSEDLHYNLNMPIPFYTREIGYYLDGNEYRLWVPERSGTVNWTRPAVGTTYSSIHGFTANDEIPFESGSSEWEQALDESVNWKEGIYGYALSSNLPGQVPNWALELLSRGREAELPRTNLLRQSTGIEHLYDFYGILEQDRLYNYYESNMPEGSAPSSNVDFSKYLSGYRTENPGLYYNTTPSGEYISHGEPIRDDKPFSTIELSSNPSVSDGSQLYAQEQSFSPVKMLRGEDPLFWSMLETEEPQAYRDILSGEDSDFSYVQSESVRKALLLIKEYNTLWGRFDGISESQLSQYIEEGGYRGSIPGSIPFGVPTIPAWTPGSPIQSDPIFPPGSPGNYTNQNLSTEDYNNIVEFLEGLNPPSNESDDGIVSLSQNKNTIVKNSDSQFTPESLRSVLSEDPLRRLERGPSVRSSWIDDPSAPNAWTDPEGFERYIRGRPVYPVGTDPRTYAAEGELEYKSPGLADFRNQCRFNTCHGWSSSSHNKDYLKFDGLQVDPQTNYGGNNPWVNEGVEISYNPVGAGSSRDTDYNVPVFNIDPGYNAWNGYTPYETIERVRYLDDPVEKRKEIVRIKSTNQAARAVLGLYYDPSIPPGMNELLRATYQKDRVPFYMDESTPSEYKQSKLSFETYNMSVPRSLRTFWLIGPSSKNELKASFPNSKITIVGDNRDASVVVGQGAGQEGVGRDNTGYDDDDQLVAVGLTNPGNYRVNYFLMSNSNYRRLLTKYSHMTNGIRPTLEGWATAAMRSRIESKDPRLLVYFRELEESENDASILLTNEFHPYGVIRDGAISKPEIALNGSRSEWLFDQYFASITGTSIEFFEQMHTIGFAHRMSKRDRDYVKHPSQMLPDWAHFVWDMLGVLPMGVGTVFDLTHAAWYYSEGKYFLAALSIIFAIPLFGDVPQIVFATGKIATGKFIAWLGRYMSTIKTILQGIRHPSMDMNILINSLERFLATGTKAAKPGAAPSSKELVDRVVSQAKDIAASRVLTQQQAIKELGGDTIGAHRLSLISSRQTKEQSVLVLDRESRRLANKIMYGNSPAMARYNSWVSKVPNIWGVRALRRGSTEASEGAFQQASRQVLDEGARASGRGFVLLAENADAIRSLGSISANAWKVEKAGIRLQASGRLTLDQISEGVKLRYLTEGGTRTVSGYGGRQFDNQVERIAGSEYRLSRGPSGSVKKERLDSAWPGDRMGGTRYWFDDVRYLNQRGVAKWSDKFGGVPGVKRVLDNLGKVGKARLFFLGVVTGALGASLSMTIHAALRIHALLELAIEGGVDDSARLIGINLQETFHNPQILKDKYAEITGGCPGFTLSGDPNVVEAYDTWLQQYLFTTVDEWLDEGFFRNLGEDVRLDDFSQYIKVQDALKLQRDRERASETRKDMFTSQWDYARDCPDGDMTLQESAISGKEYKPECDPSSDEYIGQQQSSGYSAKLPDTDVPESFYDNLSNPDNNMLGTVDLGEHGMFFQGKYYPKQIPKALILSELLAENPDKIKKEIEGVHDTLKSQFEATVLESLNTVFDGARTIDAMCDPWKVMHLLVVTKFARYLTLEDITVKYGKWNAAMDEVGQLALMLGLDHITALLEIGQAGETVLSELPKFAAMSAEFKALESQICSDSKIIMIFTLNFLKMIDYMSVQAEHGWEVQYITSGESSSVSERYHDDTANVRGENLESLLNNQIESISSEIDDIDLYRVDPSLLDEYLGQEY